MTYRLARFTTAAVALVLSGVAHGVPLTARQQRPAAAAGLDVRKFEAIEALVRDEIGQKRLPGAVVLIGVGDRIVYQKAIGNRALVPSAEPMTLDTMFDVASLTKVVATTTSVMRLIEQGKLRLVDRVATFIPGFERYGKADITIRHLLTHVSGLRPDVDLDEWVGTDVAIQRAVEEVPTAPAGTRFVYSDINFFLLGDIVRRVSGQPLDAYTQEHIFKPLGMKDTMFNPPASLMPRIAPTESCTPYGWPCDGPGREMLRGVVHDPTARRMSGVAGHAGLFSTAADLAIFCRMLLNNGSYRGERILAPLTVAKMSTPVPASEDRNLRALGWDVDSSYSGNRGELLPIGSFGHTGFTGTSLWIDPDRDLFVILLTNRVHAARAGRPAKVIADIHADVADAAALSVRNSRGELVAMPASFRADKRSGWNRPVRSRSSRSRKASSRKTTTKKPAAKPAAKKVASAGN
jgi:CubicO group peptidase (beta-lactamase class C family)